MVHILAHAVLKHVFTSHAPVTHASKPNELVKEVVKEYAQDEIKDALRNKKDDEKNS